MADIWDEMEEMSRQMELLFLEGLRRPRSRFATHLWQPMVDVYETAEEIFVLAELPGVDRERLSVSVDGRLLTIRGERPRIIPSGGGRYHQMEISFGPFERIIKLPAEVDTETAKAVYRNGLLEISFRKAHIPHVTHIVIAAEP
ncbi:MAG: Hsp20/alpha crystallin family protein [Candidatus Latescibacterota bacterium]|nr:MAG: Hsp20/alpha crystallin family protein [Candidatus Latescibacterota bacterium]